MNNKKEINLLTCPVFKNELETVLSSRPDIMIHTLDYKIHIRPAEMKNELLNTISKTTGNENSNKSKTGILVGSGCDCDIDIKSIAESCNGICPVEKNCIEIMLGPEKTSMLQQNRTSVVTQGYIRIIMKAIEDELWTADDARINYGWFDRILYMDSGIAPLTDEEILTFYDLVQVPLETDTMNLDYFTNVIYGLTGQNEI